MKNLMRYGNETWMANLLILTNKEVISEKISIFVLLKNKKHETSLHLLFIQKIIRQIEHRLHRYPSIYLLAYQALLPQFTLLEIEHVIRIEMHAVNSHLKMQMSRCRPPCPSC